MAESVETDDVDAIIAELDALVQEAEFFCLLETVIDPAKPYKRYQLNRISGTNRLDEFKGETGFELVETLAIYGSFSSKPFFAQEATVTTRFFFDRNLKVRRIEIEDDQGSRKITDLPANLEAVFRQTLGHILDYVRRRGPNS